MTKKREAILLIRHNNPATPEIIAEAVALGMIPKSELVHGGYYKGSCRNAWVAEWNEKENCFMHLRTKFGSTFKENINHPEDDTGFDVFVPLEKIERDFDE